MGLQFLSQALKERTLKKEYLCIVKGLLSRPVQVKGFLEKDEQTNTVRLSDTPTKNSSPVETIFTPLSHNATLTLVKADLITGKTHQIRSHLASIGHPILGDTKYGDEKLNQQYRKSYGIRHQLLHARYVTFPPCEGEFASLSGKKFTAPLPESFAKCMTGEDLYE